jgi:hypothetical protein
METVKVICKNHGIIQTIEGGVTWIGRPPSPMKFCPECGEKTIVERIDIPDFGYAYSPTQEEIAAAKQREIDYYRKKYWGNESSGPLRGTPPHG